MSLCFTCSAKIVSLVGEISEEVGKISCKNIADPDDFLSKSRDRLLHAYLGSETNTLSLDQVAALLDGDFLPDLPEELRALCSTQGMYDEFSQLSPTSQDDLLLAYSQLMQGRVDKDGLSRDFELAVASPAEQSFIALRTMLRHLRESVDHPLISSSLLHYQLRAQAPFQVGNENIARLWQLLVLSKWHRFLAILPFSAQLIENQRAYDESFWNAVHAKDASCFVEFLLENLYQLVHALSQEESCDSVGGEEQKEPISEQIRMVLAVIGEKTASSKELMQAVGLKHRPTFLYNYLQPALAAEVVEMVFPQTPRSRNQRYRITKRGKQLKG